MRKETLVVVIWTGKTTYSLASVRPFLYIKIRNYSRNISGIGKVYLMGYNVKINKNQFYWSLFSIFLNETWVDLHSFTMESK